MSTMMVAVMRWKVALNQQDALRIVEACTDFSGSKLEQFFSESLLPVQEFQTCELLPPTESNEEPLQPYYVMP